MRQLIPCQLDLIGMMREVFKDTDNTVDKFNLLSFDKVPIILNNQVIGVTSNDKDSTLWLNIIPEFQFIDGKLNLCSLNINMKNNEKLFKLEYESHNEK